MEQPEGRVWGEKTESFKFQLRQAYQKMHDIGMEGGEEYAGENAKDTPKYKTYAKQAEEAFLTLKALMGVEEAKALRAELQKEFLDSEPEEALEADQK